MALRTDLGLRQVDGMAEGPRYHPTSVGPMAINRSAHRSNTWSRTS